MAYCFHADTVDAEVVSYWDDECSCQIDLIHVTLRAGLKSLSLSREAQAMEGGGFVTEPTVEVNERPTGVDERYESEGDIVLVELRPEQIRVKVGPEAAKKIEDEEVVVTFDLDESDLELMHLQLGDIFSNRPGVYRRLLP